MRLFVGNLPYAATDQDMVTLFSQYGQVSSANVIMDQTSGRSRGFGFVDMPNDAEAQAAIDALNGKDLKGRALTVNQARERTQGGPR
ncbi:MAG: RNA-binding protein [Chloroflexi bacterium]|nr:RNA-binding protein [Chloroflexota bacterium]